MWTLPVILGRIPCHIVNTLPLKISTTVRTAPAAFGCAVGTEALLAVALVVVALRKAYRLAFAPQYRTNHPAVNLYRHLAPMSVAVDVIGCDVLFHSDRCQMSLRTSLSPFYV